MIVVSASCSRHSRHYSPRLHLILQPIVLQPLNMIKKSVELSEAQQRERRMTQKQEKIKNLVQQIQQSKSRQTELIRDIQHERRQFEERDNSLTDPNNYSAVDLDIRNSQLISSVQIERKRWLQSEQKEIFEILGEEEHLKGKLKKLQLEEAPLEKAKLLKLMKIKAEMLQGLAKLKPDSGLYVSHQRVLFKQCLEEIRQMNNELQESNKRFDNVQSQYLRVQVKLKNTISDLKLIVGSGQQ